MEQFIRVTDWNPGEEEYGLVPAEIRTRPDHLRGVLSRKMFTQLLNMISLASGTVVGTSLQDAPLHPGTLAWSPRHTHPPVFKDVQYGLRLVYMPPSPGMSVSEPSAAAGQIVYSGIPVVSPPAINLAPTISESEPSTPPVYTLDLALQFRDDAAFFELANREKLYYIREARTYMTPVAGTSPLVETVVLRPLKLLEVNSPLTGTPRELLSSPNFGLSEAIPALSQKMLGDETYKFLTQLVFPLSLYENLLNLANFVSASDTPGMKEVFSGTKEQIKYAFDATSMTGDRGYQQQDGSIAAAGGIVGVKEKMASLTGILESPNQGKLQNIKGVGMGYIAKALIRAPLQIIKGQAELVDPNIRISKRIQRKIKKRGKDVPIGAISFPLSWFIPPTPFGIAYLGLGLGGFDSSPKDSDPISPTEEKTEMQLEIEDKGVFITPSSCTAKETFAGAHLPAALADELFVMAEDTEE